MVIKLEVFLLKFDIYLIIYGCIVLKVAHYRTYATIAKYLVDFERLAKIKSRMPACAAHPTRNGEVWDFYNAFCFATTSSVLLSASSDFTFRLGSTPFLSILKRLLLYESNQRFLIAYVWPVGWMCYLYLRCFLIG